MGTTRCNNKFVDEFFSMLEQADRTDGGFTYVEIHSMYVEFMTFFYPNEKPLGKESIRRKLVFDGLPYIEFHDGKGKKPYLVKPSPVLLEIESIKKIVFEIKGVNLDTIKQVKKEVNDMENNCNTIYKNSDRKFESKHYKADAGSIEKFMYDKGYSLVFDKQDWVKFSDFYRDYLKFCADSIYVPLNQLTVKKFLQDSTYKVIKLVESRHDSKNLYVNVNNKKTSPKPKVVPIPTKQQPVKSTLDLMTKPIPITAELSGSVEVKPAFKLEPFTTLSGDFGQKVNNNIREFIHRRTSYDEDGIPYDTKKLYAAYRYYMKDKNIYSFNQFRYVISCIPAARLESDYDNNTEVSRIIPEFEYLSRMEEKNRAGLIQMQISNYYKRVTKALEETKKIYEQLESENGWYPAVVEEEKEDKDKVEEVKKDFAEIQHNIKSAFGGEQHKKEISSATIETKKVELKEDDKSLGFIDAAIHDIENNYAGVIRKYKALEELKQVIKEEKVKVHDDLKPIFDMLVDNSLKKFEEINPTFPSFEKEVEDLKNNLRNLSNFVKKA